MGYGMPEAQTTSPRSCSSASTRSSPASPGRSTRSAASGRSYGSSMPVNPTISPARAFAYSPLGSRRSHYSSGVSTKT